jgi:uridine phosphorylase
MIGTNFPKDAEGRVYHLALKAGELANNIIIVGDPNRAEIVSKHLKPDPDLPNMFPHTCARGFTAYTGLYNGTRVSVVSIGMGFPMVDFFVREARAILDGKVNIIRLGSCGCPQESIQVGTVVASKYAVGIYADTRPYHQRKLDGSRFTITDPNFPDRELHETLVKNLITANKAFPVVEAGNASADYFYSSQGREDDAFPDNNKQLIGDLLEKYPDLSAIEMESYLLFDLADMNTDKAPQGEGIAAAACAIVLAARKTGVFLTNEKKHEIEYEAGKACLETLHAVHIKSAVVAAN